MRRDELHPVAGVLSLIRELIGPATRADNIADLFVSSFRALDHAIDFDLAAAVMIEQNLDLYVVTREGAESLVGPPLIESLRRTLEMVIPSSFAAAEVVVKAERSDLPRHEAGDSLEHSTHAIITVGNRSSGVLLIYRGKPFDERDQQIVEIFAAQVSLLLGQLSAREQIQGLADTDELTGIANKRFFRRQLPQEMERARVYSVPLSLLMFDVDDFKEINDNFGHTVGDVVLSELCGAVRDTLRPPDLIARFGGDEFAIILPHTDLSGACAVADRILQEVRMLTIPADDEGTICCSISLGIADYQRHDTTAGELIRRADERLYEAKRAGKNRYSA
ncbi:MAG TPA: GGDEF domain-containing protein [Thermoanaerobaculia bacterium]|nr:GGDEF domain-containing protein [Thermoanaerobaculia bacterium]